MPAIVTVEKAVARPPSQGAGAAHHRVALDPARAACGDAIRALVEDRLRAASDVPVSPDATAETLTLLLGGRAEHIDSAGVRRTLEPGDVQRSVGGTLRADAEAHLLCLTLRRAADAVCQTIAAVDIPVVDHGSALVRVLAGDHGGQHGPASCAVTCLDVAIEPRGGGVTVVLACVRGIAYAYEGAASIAGARIEAGDLALLDVRGTVPLEIDAGAAARLIVVAAPNRLAETVGAPR